MADVPTGAIIGEATLVEIKKYLTYQEWMNDLPEHLNLPDWYEPGLYGLIFNEIKKYSEPIPYKGQLGFFEVAL